MRYRSHSGPWLSVLARLHWSSCTNVAGSVPDAADFVVSDPVEAGVMAVMLIADTGNVLDRARARQALLGQSSDRLLTPTSIDPVAEPT